MALCTTTTHPTISGNCSSVDPDAQPDRVSAKQVYLQYQALGIQLLRVLIFLRHIVWVLFMEGTILWMIAWT